MARVLAAGFFLATFLPAFVRAAVSVSPLLIPEAEALAMPTPARLDALVTRPWQEIGEAAAEAAFAAHAANRTAAASAWLRIVHWSRLFSEPERTFIPRWIRAVQGAGVAHPNMAPRYEAAPAALGDRLSPELRRWILGNDSFSEKFLESVKPVDFLPRVFDALERIHRADAASLAAYPSLAIAIALVYDVPPPPSWPHSQVSPAALPRRWPDPEVAFGWWVAADRAGRTLQRLGRLDTEQLKFVVDAAAPADEREWARTNLRQPLGDLAATYFLVEYRLERIQAQAHDWPGRTYRLEEILAAGGICVDQAYFAAEAGKARGVPTLLFRGEGLDGRHAWFGYLGTGGSWQMDAGRYAEQRFLTGYAYDPQTWLNLTDHELTFLAEGFHELPSFGQSRAHAAIAAELLRRGETTRAVATARVAVNYERRNVDAWEVLLRAQASSGSGSVAYEASLREAARALQQYPDLELAYVNRLVASLRERGETSLADLEERQIAQKYRAERGDLSVQQAALILQRSFDTQPVAEQIRAFDTALERFGQGAGIEFFDRIVLVFAEHMVQLRRNADARRAVERARGVLVVPSGSQLQQEFDELMRRLR